MKRAPPCRFLTCAASGWFVAYGLAFSDFQARGPLGRFPGGVTVTRRAVEFGSFLLAAVVLAGLLVAPTAALPADPPTRSELEACIACHVKPPASRQSPQPAAATADAGCAACHKTQAPADAAGCEACHHK
jgi:hypothetical protein